MHRRMLAIIALMVLLTLFLGAGPGQAQSPPAEATLSLGTGFTYQGRLRDGGGSPITANCDLTFGLWDAASSGSQVGNDSVVTGVAVADGYFAALVNGGGEFGTVAFTGEARWLEIAVKCAGDAGYTTLSPRQALTAAPYALGLRPGAVVEGLVNGPGLTVRNSITYGSNHGLLATTDSPNGRGVYGWGPSYGVYGRAGSYSDVTYGIYGEAYSGDGHGVSGINQSTVGNATGVYGESKSAAGRGVYGVAPKYGVFAQATATAGDSFGVYGRAESPYGRGVFGWAPSPTGVTLGVYGKSDSNEGTAVHGWASATSGTTYGVNGRADSPNGYGVYGAGGYIGVYGYSSATSARGVSGYVDATTGTTYGVFAVSASTAGRGVYGYASAASGTTYGLYGAAASSAGRGVYGSALATSGTNYGVYGQASSPGGYAGYFINNSADGIALYAEGSGAGRNRATLRVNNTEESGGMAAYLTNNSNYHTLHLYNAKALNGGVLYLQNANTGFPYTYGDFITAVNVGETNTLFKVSGTGEVFSDVGFSTPAPGMAQMVPGAAGLEPGDVLAAGGDGQLVRSSAAYQPTVVGVYVAQPGFVAGRPAEGAAGEWVPLAVLGIVPVKVSAENGTIAPGDLLVAAATPGHAMRAGPAPAAGTVVGKALEGLDGGTGIILMLVLAQ